MFKAPSEYMVNHPILGMGEGNNGCFRFTVGKSVLTAISSDGGGWEHVSVSLKDRCPTWEEMCKVKSMFWSDDDVVVQYHPAKKDYVNNHNYCLHLWRPIDSQIPTPPKSFVGI